LIFNKLFSSGGATRKGVGRMKKGKKGQGREEEGRGEGKGREVD